MHHLAHIFPSAYHMCIATNICVVDFMISTRGPQPGAKLIEWNMHDPAGAPGSCGMWDVHYRIGGAIGTNMNPSNCPRCVLITSHNKPLNITIDI